MSTTGLGYRVVGETMRDVATEGAGGSQGSGFGSAALARALCLSSDYEASAHPVIVVETSTDPVRHTE